ncbi:MAG: hypothetical protein LYZ66_03620 [Nitrososphaerales archaeon]|nr:hypothetical protein [Nitrososphaerales archaeon]
MFGSNYCNVCGMKVDKTNDFQRFGKHFDSEEHAQQYVQETEKSRQAAIAKQTGSEEQKRNGCC